MKIRKQKRTMIKSYAILLLLIALPIIILSSRLPQTFLSSAQTLESIPPFFYCLSLGQSDTHNCASQQFQNNLNLSLHNAPLSRNKIVYYNDTLVGSTSYTNTGDKAITIQSLGIAAESENNNKRINFINQKKNVTLQPGQSVSLSNASHMFKSPEPGGTWQVFGTVTLADGRQVDSNTQTTISVSTACTALRAIPADGKDMVALQLLCAGHPNDSLCKSKQYCEITGGANCTQSAPTQDYLENNLQCNQYIIMPDKEQNLLEQLCKEYPSTDTCKDFCNRTYGSAICPDPNTTNPTAQVNQPMVAGAMIAKANASCRTGVSNYIGQCCATTQTYISAAGNELCGSAPSGGGGGAAPAPVKNAPQCSSGLANKIGQCCAVGTCLVNGLCSRACGGGGSSGGGAPAKGPACSSGTANSIGQCCKYNGPLLSTGQCPLGPGGTGSPPARVITAPNGTPARSCAYPYQINAGGVCGPLTGVNDPNCGAFDSTTNEGICKICNPPYTVNSQGVCSGVGSPSQ